MKEIFEASNHSKVSGTLFKILTSNSMSLLGREVDLLREVSLIPAVLALAIWFNREVNKPKKLGLA
jgi:hypothetical protein